MKINTGQI